MRLRHTSWVAASFLSLFLASHATAAQVPRVAQHIPDDAVYALMVSNPGEALGNLDSILQKFKSISPEMDLKRLGEELKEDLGENVLTVEGLKALGLDPAGTYAFYGSGLERGPVIVLALEAPEVFKTRLIAMIKKNNPNYEAKPKTKAGIEIYEVDRGYIGIKNSWCVVLPPESVFSGQKDKQLLEFFKAGKKLARHPAFSRTVKNMPDDLHALLYLDLKRIVSLVMKQGEKSLQQLIKIYQGRKDRKDRQDVIMNLKAELAQMRKLGKKVNKELAFIDRAALGWTIRARSIDSAGFLGATPAGLKTLNDIFPAQKDTPAFHSGLMESSVFGAWMSLDLLKLLDKFGWIPLYGDMTIEKSLQQDAKLFKQDTKIDFFKDLLGGLAGSGAFYLLQPGEAASAANLNSEQQVLQMIRTAFVVQLKDPKKAAALLERFNQVVTARERSLKTEDISGASITTISPEPGLAFSWGLKGDTAFITFGENTAQALVKILPGKAWAGKSKTGSVGSGLLDFAVLSEGIASAMARGVGGPDAAQFRMMVWPIVQQVLGKLSKIHFSARMVAGGLSTSGSLEFR